MKKENPVGKKGYTGNPNGRPKKGCALTDVLKNKADPEALAEKLLDMAKTDFSALKYVYDRIDGTAVQTIKQHITEENPVHDLIRKLVYGERGTEQETEDIPKE